MVDLNNEIIGISGDYIICPITQHIFYRPVITSDGFTYEEHAIREVMSKTNKSPMTQEYLTNEIIENKSIKRIVGDILEDHPEYKDEQFPDDFYVGYDKNRNKIINFIKHGPVDEILKYKRFQLNDLISIKTLLNWCLTTAPLNVAYHILSNSIDLEGNVKAIMTTRNIGFIDCIINSLDVDYFRNNKAFIYFVIKLPDSINTIKLINEKGVDLTFIDDFGLSPFIMACASQNEDVMKYLFGLLLEKDIIDEKVVKCILEYFSADQLTSFDKEQLRKCDPRIVEKMLV